ncbi:MAG: hypothetical protein ACM3JD_10285 [Rudaea sp.]
MNKPVSIFVGAVAAMYAASYQPAAAQDAAPPSYKGDPEVYKVIFEDKNFRVIDALRKAGQHDKLHSHPVPSVIYFLTDCKDKLYGPGGKTIISEHKAGTVLAAPIVKAHSTENIGTGDCHQIFVERK